MSAISQENYVPAKKILPALGLFIVIATILSAAAYALIIKLGIMHYYMVLLMWMPGISALLTCKLMGFNIAMFGWRWGKTRWQLFGYFLPICYGLIAYGFIWTVGLGSVVSPHYVAEVSQHLGLSGWADTQVLFFSVFIFGVTAIYWRLGNALGEELAWRGFLVPLLMQKYNFAITSILIGIIWAAWHAPLILYTKYNAGPYDLEIQFLNFSLLLIGLSFIMTYLRLKSGNVWSSAMLHASHNAFVLSVFSPMTEKYENSWRYIGEFGFVVPAVVAVLGLYFWYRAHKEKIAGPLIEV